MTDLIKSYLRAMKQSPPESPLRVLDLCTGSGCIALTLAARFNSLTAHGTITSPIRAHVTAVDISPRALQLSLVNQRRLGIPSSVITFLRGDITQTAFMHSLSKDGPFDLIISNPPYIPPEQYAELDDSVSKWEDRGALFAADDGLGFHRLIAQHAVDHLLRRQDIFALDSGLPRLVMEIGEGQANGAVKSLKDAGFVDARAKKDLAGIERVVLSSLV